MITAVLFGLAVLSVLSTFLALFTPRRPLVVGWLAWVVGSFRARSPGPRSMMNVLLLGVSVVFVPLDSVFGIATIALFAASMVGNVVLAHRTRGAEATVRRALRAALGEDFEHDVDPDLVPVVQRPVSPLREAIAPFRARRRDVEHVADVPYGNAGVRNQLDLYFAPGLVRGGPRC